MSQLEGLERELAFYEENRNEYLENHEGMFVLIKGSTLVGVFSTALAAYEDGLNRFGLQPFLVKLVLETEPVSFIPAYFVTTNAGL